MVIDMHASVVPGADDPAVDALAALPHTQYDPRTCTLEATLDRMDRAGVERSVVWCLGPTLDECRRYNDFIADLARDHPDRFIPFATVFPTGQDDDLEELRRAFSDLGMAGLKLHPEVFQTPISDPAFLALVAELRSLDKPFVTHVHPALLREIPGSEAMREVTEIDAINDPISTTPRPAFSDPHHLEALTAVWNSPRVQAAHMGGVFLDTIRQSSITFQTTGASPEVINWSIRRLGVERVVFGSDYPFFSVEDEIAKVRELELPEEDKTAILGGNAVRRVLSTDQ